jgi:hypothetical protein
MTPSSPAISVAGGSQGGMLIAMVLIAKDVVVIIILRCVKRARYHGAYVAPFYGTEEFGSCFYSIHIPKSVSQPIEQLNYAHIIVEKG